MLNEQNVLGSQQQKLGGMCIAQKTCPNCGHCPACGRANWYPWGQWYPPYYVPRPTYWGGATWVSNGNGATWVSNGNGAAFGVGLQNVQGLFAESRS